MELMNKNTNTLNIAFAFILGIFTTYFLSFIGFIFHLSITSIFLIIGLISAYFSLFLQRKNYFSLIKTIIIFTAILIITYYIASHTIDYSWDGRTYHQLGIILLNEGWNPIFDNLTNFVNIHNYPPVEHLIWVENYTKFAEIIGANVYALTNNLEAGKIINWLSAFTVFFYANYTFDNISSLKPNGGGYKTKIINIIFSLLLSACPIVISQIYTFYVDGNLYCYFILILLALINTEIAKDNIKKNLFIFVFSTVILINIKLVGILYIFIILLVYFAYKKMKPSKSFLVSTLIILLLGLLSGINPYFTNIAQGRNPIYPLAGKGKIDILTHNMPKEFKNKLMPYKLIISTFSTVKNHNYETKSKIKLKCPLTFRQSELYNLKFTDVRLCGFGIFWSGILILALIQLLLIKNQNNEEKKIMWLITAIICLSVLSNPECWWARYAPQFWALPVFIVYFKIINSDKIMFISIFTIIFMFLNILIYLLAASVVHKEFIYQLNTINNYNKVVRIYSPKKFFEYSFFQKLDNKNIKYKIINQDEYIKDKDKFYNPSITVDKDFLWDLKM